MKAFKFRLQTKLDISQRQEELAREEMLIKIQKRDFIITELGRLEDRMLRVQQSARSINSFNSFQEMIALREYIPVFKEQIKMVQDALAQAEEDVEEARQKLLQKARECKTLHKLKDKEWADYLYKFNQQEQKIIDETANNNHYKQIQAIKDKKEQL